jgi:hypothetical protein
VENYYDDQLCDSAADPGNESETLRGHRSNCATAVVGCVCAGVPMAHQEV